MSPGVTLRLKLFDLPTEGLVHESVTKLLNSSPLVTIWDIFLVFLRRAIYLLAATLLCYYLLPCQIIPFDLCIYPDHFFSRVVKRKNNVQAVSRRIDMDDFVPFYKKITFANPI